MFVLDVTPACAAPSKNSGELLRGRGGTCAAHFGGVLGVLGLLSAAEELGGADVHTSKSGVADHYAENEPQASNSCPIVR